ncbi:unnamed protein product [Fructobacillus fructosus]|uniref:Uncharacterized protein n=1 Tax=Fructobacillus fructosus TaxID=1631 RepID=A0ABM9MZW6_9LACO|nr:unnamed protein product [Fructobacillus fructosus]CAK1251673.1 unnamed protein product [Fructobacillus fructosus]
MHELTINDLRRLGRIGNVEGMLKNGKKGKLKADGFYFIRTDAVINGMSASVAFKMPFIKALTQLYSLSQGHKIVAKRQAGHLVATQNYGTRRAPKGDLK